jgi:hypothetical protein
MDDRTLSPTNRIGLFVGPGPLPPAAVRAGLGFRTVVWRGVTYSFTPRQASAVAELYRAWLTGMPEVPDTALLFAAATNAVKVSALFHGNPAWATLVVKGSRRDLTRLAPDPE